jgi:hypothetical protein
VLAINVVIRIREHYRYFLFPHAKYPQLMRITPLLTLVLCVSACDVAAPRELNDAGVRDSRGPMMDARVTAQDTGPDTAEPPRDRVTDDCRFYSERQDAFIPLYGDVEFVRNFADFQVREVSSFSDLDVELVNAFPNNCGEWHEVSSFPDFTVQLVDSFGDFDIRYVNSFPGLP